MMRIRSYTAIIVTSLILSGIAGVWNSELYARPDNMVDIRDAIAIVSTGMGIKIVVDSEDIRGQIPLDLDNLAPRQIRAELEKALNEAGFAWISVGGVVRIVKKGQMIWTSTFDVQPPLSYYLDVIDRNNLFRPLGIEPETQPEFILTGVFSVGESKRAIIEDTKRHKSYYVSRGESAGDFTVAEITERQVILAGNNGSITLRIQEGQKQ